MDQAIDYGRRRRAIFCRPRIGCDGREVIDMFCVRAQLVVTEGPSGGKWRIKYEVAE